MKAGNGKGDYVGKAQRVFDGIVKNLKFLGADGQILTAGKSGKVPPGQINGTGNVAEAFRYFYHPDHLGSTSYVTDASGEVFQHLEYFAFGETFIEEHSNTDRTPYLFNGKELDEETGLYYYGMRYYDTKISTWISVDPLAEKYPMISPYTYCGNNPILYVDPDGGEIWIYYDVTSATGAVTRSKVQYKGGKLYEPGGTAYTGTNAYVAAVKADLDKFKTDHPEGAYKLNVLEKSAQIHTLENTSGYNNNSPASSSDDRAGIPTGSTTKYDPTNRVPASGVARTPRVGLAHELLGHGYDSDQGKSDYGTTAGIVNYEISAVNAENLIRLSTGEPQRTTYGSSSIPAADLKDPKSYKIRAGNTLSGIAKSAGTTVSRLLALNPKITDPNKIKAGDAITIK